jgi:RING finger/CHY zinc finger protein 1
MEKIVCIHYNRGCSFISPCCEKIYPCRHCHDEAEDTINIKKPHKMDRFNIKEIICNKCDTKQLVSNKCINANCNIEFAKYFCSKCNFFDDKIENEYFHCEGCGICRVGGRDNFFHCNDCGYCLSINLQNNHKCKNDALKQECPTCLEDLFTSIKPSISLLCGHLMHSECYHSYIKSGSLKCPLCRKSIITSENLKLYNEALDAEIAATPLPIEITGNKINITCNDCSFISELYFHPFGLKCSNCKGYNTTRI